MNPRRRKILATAPFMLAVATAPILVHGQDSVPKEGREYRLLSPPQPVDNKTRIEVIEFFSYACPHCNAFEPIIEPWIKRLPPVVLFHRVPVLFFEPWIPLARLYYTLEVLGEAERLTPAVFAAVHQSHLRLNTDAEIGDFLEKNGIPHQKFIGAWNSFSVQSAMARVVKLQASYDVDGVPMMAVDGRYLTSNTMNGGKHEAVLPVVDYLIGEARKIRKL